MALFPKNLHPTIVEVLSEDLSAAIAPPLKAVLLVNMQLAILHSFDASPKYIPPPLNVSFGLFVVFMFGLLFLTFEDNGISWMKSETPGKAWERLRTGVGVNFVPFKTIRSYLKYSSGSENTMVNIAGNIFMFVPWGLGLPLLWRKCRSVWKVMLASVMLPIFIEFCQLFIGRSVDIDDVILNFVGGMLGGLLYFLLSRCFPFIDKVAR